VIKTRNRVFVIIVIFFIGITSLFAQNEKKSDVEKFRRTIPNLFLAQHDKFDTTYIENHSYKFLLRFYGINKFNYLFFSHNNSPRIILSPNRRDNVGFGFNYLWLGINFAFNLPFINNDNDTYGETERMDCQMYIYGRKSVFEMFLQYYKGFYITNPEVINPNWNSSMNYPQLPGALQLSLGASYNYVFNSEKFSYKAAFIQNEIQKKSAGSPLLGMSLSLFGITNSSNSLIPNNIRALMQSQGMLSLDSSEIRRVNYNSIGIMGGYAYTLVVKKRLFISLSVEPGIGYGWVITEKKSKNRERKEWVSPNLTGRFSCGYNMDKYFLVFAYYVDTEAFRDDKNVTAFSLGYWKISAGVRLNWFKDFSEKVKIQMR